MVLRRILERPVGTRRPTVHLLTIGSVAVRVVHHYAVSADVVEEILEGELRRTGAQVLGVASILPDLFIADAPGWNVGVAVAHRSWAVPLADLSVHAANGFTRQTRTTTPTTPTLTEVDVVGSWCRSRAAEQLARAAGTTPQHVDILAVADGLLLGIAVG